MTSSSRQQRQLTSQQSGEPGDRSPESVRRLMLGAATALFVARPLMPSEAATAGDGLPWVMLWLLIALAWIVVQSRAPKWELRTGRTDMLLVAMVGWIVVTGVWAIFHAAPRPATNMIWEWLALLIGFLLLRQLVRTEREARAVVMAMLALAVALAAFGLHQYFVSLPEARRQYAADPDGMLREIRQWSPPGSPERIRFEQRLASTEPMATFALANSLAGFLAPWLVLALGLAMLARGSVTKWRIWIAAVATVLPLAAVLVLTKSRSAYLATLAGIALLALLRRGRVGARFGVLAGVAIIAAIVGMLAMWLGAVDREVFSEAGKSLGYRWEYWRATWAMIVDHPWLGCGPGNFQDAYLHYKLPTASEEIADPHNFILEVWATAGTPAVLLLLAAAVSLASCVWRAAGNGASRDSAQAKSDDAHRAIAWGALVGFVLACGVGIVFAPLIEVPLAPLAMLGGLVVAAAVFAIWWPWIEWGRLTPGVSVIAVAVLAINLLAAGGMTFPGIASSLWLLIALTLNLVSFHTVPLRLGRPLAWCGAGLVGLLIVTCYVTAYRPVVTAQGERFLAQQDPRNAEAHLQAAVAADRWAYEPRAELAYLYLAKAKQHPSKANWEQFEAAQREALDRRPDSATAFRRAGHMYLEAFGAQDDPAMLERAVQAFESAVVLYPNDGATRAQLALALFEMGNAAEAASEAQSALRLDEITPHADRKLAEPIRRQLRSISAASN